LTEETVPLRPISSLRLFLLELLEPLVRLAGWLGAVAGKDRHGVEMVVRGMLFGGGYRWQVGRNVSSAGPASRFRFGKDVCFYGNAYPNANGPNAFVEIGRHTDIDQFAILYGQGGLRVGAECAIASRVVVAICPSDASLPLGLVLFKGRGAA
jgi:hypothetical protein